ncbi:MAG: gliding motility-associated C-terminal domain-containing protein [Bacteroidales bacterium]
MSRSFATLLLLLLFLPGWVAATHNRAGEITYRHLGGYTYEATVLTYTFTPSAANRDSLTVNWGDGSQPLTIPIDQKIFLPNNVRYNTYVGVHTFPGPGTYIISMEDPNRNAGVVNIPGSVNEPFYIESMLVINPFLGPNTSPTLLAPPIDNACVGYPFLHNPTAFDPDGDSLSYSLIVCKGESGWDIKSYFDPPASNSLGIDPVTGDFLWDSPTFGGDYNIAILIEEWRYGVRVGYVIRDMQIFVASCNNQPPVIAEVNDTCVVVGDTLLLTITATDPNNDQVTLSATGGPLVINPSPATFPDVTAPGTATGIFRWIPGCNAVRKQPHLVSFKAADNGTPVNLFDLESVFITVIAPAPDTLEVFPVGKSMVVDWSTSPCSGASGYSIYRKVGPSSFVPGPCVTGVPAWTGFVRIATVSGVNNTLYIDDDNGTGLMHGVNYCYRVVADFPDGAQSLASIEVCSELVRDVPIITNISVNTTDAVTGSMYLAWVPPQEIDTVIAPGPYQYVINRSSGSPLNFQFVDTINNILDTTFTDTLINTRDGVWFYRIDFFNNQPGNRFLIGSTDRASSVFVEPLPQDLRIDLAWSPVTPWLNLIYVIYRQNPLSGQFDSIGSTTAQSWSDTALTNGTTYCYFVKSIGTYGSAGIIDPLINFSQVVCAVPFDDSGPCSPPLTITTDCITNEVRWGLPPEDCGGDIAKYELWFSPLPDGEFNLIYTSPSPYDTLFHHVREPASVVGCYKIRGIDSTGNIGPFGEVVCIDSDSCDSYRLPNVFTPNGDNFNDLLRPFPYSNVERINLSIMSRWGNEVFTSADPEINWDGTDQKTGIQLSAGVYYYVCDVWFYSLEGIRKRTLTGIVHLMR